jgi:hypothetical protein
MTGETISTQQSAKLPITAHLLCGWPLALVALGGAIGGGLGGAAYAINLAVYKSRAPLPAKILLNILAGVGAIVIWVVAAAFIQKALGK